MTRVLFIVQRFHEGWGGAPESIRLLARALAQDGVTSDVLDRGVFVRRIEELDRLPVDFGTGRRVDTSLLSDYDVVVHAGPWQNPFSSLRILRALTPDQRFYYLPRGGLAEIEFRFPKNLKKLPFFHAVERRVVRRAERVVYSSQIEKSESRVARKVNPAAAIIPDHFFPLAGPRRTQPAARPAGAITIGFLAEVNVRKGLVPFLKGVAALAPDPSRPVCIRVGGMPRHDGKEYYEEARQIAATAPCHVTVEFIGRVAHADRTAFYDGIDLFVVPSLFESYCLTLLEALTDGCTLLASPDLGVLEHLPASEHVSVLAGLQPAQISQGLQTALDRLRERPDGRDDVCRYAAKAVNAINRNASDAWVRLLQGKY